MKIIPCLIITLAACLITACADRERNLSLLFTDVQAGKYSRTEALQRLAAATQTDIDLSEQKVKQLGRRMVLQIAEQELTAIQKTNPALIQARCYGVVVEYAGLKSRLGVIQTLEEFDGMVKQAESDIALCHSKFGPTATIKASGTNVKIVITTQATNLNGTLVEATTETSFPLDWVKQYAPALIQDSSKNPLI